MESNALIDLIVKVLRGDGATDRAAQSLEGRPDVIQNATGIPTAQNPGVYAGPNATGAPAGPLSERQRPPGMPQSWGQ
jgi:hypothetical protein